MHEFVNAPVCHCACITPRAISCESKDVQAMCMQLVTMQLEWRIPLQLAIKSVQLSVFTEQTMAKLFVLAVGQHVISIMPQHDNWGTPVQPTFSGQCRILASQWFSPILIMQQASHIETLRVNKHSAYTAPDIRTYAKCILTCIISYGFVRVYIQPPINNRSFDDMHLAGEECHSISG